MKWQNNKKDGNDWPYDPTFINSPGVNICPATAVLSETSRRKNLRTLRKFRDEVLSQIPAGREIIALYCQWEPAVGRAMDEDEELRKEVKGLIDAIVPFIEVMVE